MNHSPSRRLNVLVMHTDPLLCAGLVSALRQHAAFEIRVDGVDSLQTSGPGVDVVIADYTHAMHLAGLAARKLQGPCAGARILALTSNDREADIRRAIEAGIHGYLLLGGSLHELVEGVSAVGSGLRYLGSSVAQRMADSLSRAALTSRETEVLRLVATGQSNKAIARQLDIELGTVKSHVSAVMTKLGASSRTQAASIAAARGLIDEREPARSQPYALHAPALESRSQFAGIAG